MNDSIRTGLIISAIAVPAIAVIIFVIILLKVRKKKKEIIANQQLIEQNLQSKSSEKKMIERKDFGESDENLKNILKNSISHEIVEFCINTCIRNEYKNVLMISKVEFYESIVLSNKANVNVYIEEKNFDLKKYNELIENNNISQHKIVIIKNLENIDNFDAILVLNSYENFDSLFIEYENILKENGMFIFANTKSNKKSLKKLVNTIKNYKYRYDIINWYTGFITIVKSFV